ncbi:GTPase/DUF3482 domain-containing protein [Ottowia sp.]|uniref:GTPase/DUF3482 domain-containing protein n=1 Tax=Ottowia sp. TaxID=1898956 RepID=UPI002C79414C|nr:GTPase/DUF3482 domain-containing protein [Ottowia sp.]HRN76937.1 GTPase/DUF3482 domain-containing protein [Ottowia sp.]HRQ04315.1 GTPase/DUF3482 domain-containing protein [Ottowia sp.]
MTEPLRIAIVGHTNAGKTSLLRTLTRQVDFGEVSDRPGTTRHAEAIDLRLDGSAAVRFIDTPGLEDSVALLEYLGTLEAESRPERVRAFLRGPEARESFEQEAKVLRALIEQADAAMVVIDTREPVLPKYRAEIEILTWCAKPIMPVLNFVRYLNTRRDDWHQMLLESNLHARVEFDVVAPFIGSERQLYGDLATLLPARRQQLQQIVEALALEARDRRLAACRVVASGLIDVAAMRRALPAEEFADELKQQRFVRAFQDDVRRHARRAVDDLLAVFAFRPDDAELAEIPQLAGRWEDDLFNPELLKEAGKRLGMGAMIGAGLGAVADVALAGLSLGAASALGATIGGAVSGGWKPLWRKLDNRLSGVQELTVEAPVLLLLTDHLLALARALEQRGHAALDKLRVSASGAGADDGLHRLVDALDAARGHPEWERAGGKGAADSDRQALEAALARQLAERFERVPA